MFRLVVSVVVLGALAFGFAWLADRPGTITVDWLGQRIETTAFVAAVIGLVGVIVAIGFWQLIRYLIHGPEAFQLFMRTRKREKGLAAIGRGLVAVGAGDTRQALKAADDAERLLGKHPMSMLLTSQAAQLAGDRKHATETFEAMLKDPETRTLGLRGLFVEAQRANDAGEARRFAEAALAARPGIPWAANAVLAFQAGAREWDKALDTVRSNADNRLVDRAHAKRLRAVIQTARAIETEATDRAGAKALALEAHGLAPELVPAAEIAARLLTEAGDVRKATKVIEQTWKLSPHPDLAAAYTHARMGDAARDRLKRARQLADLAPRHPEALMAVAAAAMEARDFAEARSVLAPLTDEPTRRVCLLMAAIAEAEGHVGEAREWLGRSVRAGADPAWTADGFVSDRWLPMSPVTAKLDAFEWKVPVEAAPGQVLPRVTMPVIPDPIDVTPPQALVAPEAVKPAPVAPAPEIVPPVVAAPSPAPAPTTTAAAPATDPPADRRNVVVLNRAPDDPGPDGVVPSTPSNPAKRRFGLF